FATPALPQPRWDGSDLRGRTLLLQAEQGLGDTLQFIRYAPLVKQRGGRVVVHCQPVLRQLLERAPGIDALVSAGDTMPPIDVCTPLLSVPGLLKTRLENVPAEIPYLSADPARVERWQKELERVGPGPRIGIAWQ